MAAQSGVAKPDDDAGWTGAGQPGWFVTNGLARNGANGLALAMSLPIGELLDLTRIESGQLGIRHQSVVLAAPGIGLWQLQLAAAQGAVGPNLWGGKVVLADVNAQAGEALAAVGADILSVAERQAQALSRLGEHLLDGWGNVDAAGVSGLSFWPVHIGRTRLALTVSGRPRFNQPAFAELVWALYVRYGKV